MFFVIVQLRVGNILLTLGYLQYYNNDLEVAEIRIAVIAVCVIGGILILLAVIFVIWFTKFREKYPLPKRLATVMGMRTARSNTYAGELSNGVLSHLIAESLCIHMPIFNVSLV